MYPKAAIGLAVFESFSSHESCHVFGTEFQLGIFYKGNTVALHTVQEYRQLVLVVPSLGVRFTTRPFYFQGIVPDFRASVNPAEPFLLLMLIKPHFHCHAPHGLVITSLHYGSSVESLYRVPPFYTFVFQILNELTGIRYGNGKKSCETD